MLQRWEPDYVPRDTELIDIQDIPGPVLAVLDAGHGEALAVIAEALPGMLQLYREWSSAPLGDANGGGREYRRLDEFIWAKMGFAYRASTPDTEE